MALGQRNRLANMHRTVLLRVPWIFDSARVHQLYILFCSSCITEQLKPGLPARGRSGQTAVRLKAA